MVLMAKNGHRSDLKVYNFHGRSVPQFSRNLLILAMPLGVSVMASSSHCFTATGCNYLLLIIS